MLYLCDNLHFITVLHKKEGLLFCISFLYFSFSFDFFPTPFPDIPVVCASSATLHWPISRICVHLLPLLWLPPYTQLAPHGASRLSQPSPDLWTNGHTAGSLGLIPSDRWIPHTFSQYHETDTPAALLLPIPHPPGWSVPVLP